MKQANWACLALVLPCVPAAHAKLMASDFGFYYSPSSPTHEAHPNSDGCELDESEVVGVTLFEGRCDGPECLSGASLTFHQARLVGKAGAELLKQRPAKLR